MRTSSIDTVSARTPAQSLALDGPRLVVERKRASDDNDEVTRETIEQMARYIRESVSDPVVARAAEQARKFGNLPINTSDARSRQMLDCWGVFWWIKHAVQFRNDDGALMQFGETNQQDLLISPAVLLRMKEPKEDCDGFSMLTCALLSVLGVPAYLVTVAADPSDHQRWSHVFSVAMVDGKVIPLDTSHGEAPGWMVPPEHIFRLQAWNLDGKKTTLPWPKRSTLHGYMRAGLGDTYFDPESGTWTSDIDTSGTWNNPGASIPDTFGGTGPGSGGMGPSSGGILQNILQAISGAGATARTIAATASAPAGYSYNPTTGRYVQSGVPFGATFGSGGVSGSVPWLPILGIGLVAAFFFGGRK